MKANYIFIKLVLLISIGFGAQTAYTQVESTAFNLTLDNLLSHSVDEINVQKADSIKTEMIFLDSRTKKEYEVSHIKNAIWVGYEEFKLNHVSEVPKNKPVIVYCSVGYRSEKIAEKLKTSGYEQVYNLYGGIFEWINQDKPVYNQHRKTNKVHAYDHIWGIWLNKGEKVYK